MTGIRPCVALAFVVTTSLGAVTGVAAATPAASGKSSTVLYRANWKHGADGWALAPHYSIKNGKLVYDGSNQGGEEPASQSPFKKAGQDFAVVAKVTVGKVRSKADNFVGIDARITAKHSVHFLYEQIKDNGIIGGTTDTPEIGYTNGAQAGWVPGDVNTPLTGTHTFRAEIVGNNYRLLIDGQQAVPWTTFGEVVAKGVVGVVGSSVAFTVSSFKVVRLAATAVTPTNTPDVLSSHALSAADAGLTNSLDYFLDNWWIASVNSESVDQVNQSRIYTDERYLTGETDAAYEELVQYQTAADAQARFQGDQTYFSDPNHLPANATPLDTSAFGLGSQIFGFSDSFTGSDGNTYYEEAAWFPVGDYYASVDVVSLNQGDIAKEALADFQAAAKRMSS